MRDEKEGRRSKQGQTYNKAKQHSPPKAVTWWTVCIIIDVQVHTTDRRCLTSANLYGSLWIDVLAATGHQQCEESAQLHQEEQAVVVGLLHVGQRRRLELQHDRTELRDVEQRLGVGRRGME